jgi:hypothetical protein
MLRLICEARALSDRYLWRTEGVRVSNRVDVILSRPRGPDPTLDSWDSWTTWGRMALMNGQLEAAVGAFGRAATAADRDGDALIGEQLHAIERLARRLLALRRRRDEHRAAQAALEAAEHRTLCELLDRVPRTGALPGEPTLTELDDTAPPGPAQASVCRLAIDLLGPMEVAVDNVQVRCWSGSRARSVLAYLATHRTPWPSCEVLTDVFWPRSPAAAARNSLHVAIHGVRRAMRAVTDRPVIVRDGDTYRVHRSVQLRLDIEEFERRLALGRRHHDGGRHQAAIAEYEGARRVVPGRPPGREPLRRLVDAPA